jgi:hypothetical protein
MADAPAPRLAPGLGIPAHLQQMFQRIDQPGGRDPFRQIGTSQYGPSVKRIEKGSLIHFKYTNFKHDPYPLVVITDIFPNHIRGVNLHYLTFNYVKQILRQHCDNNMFSYLTIRGDQFLVNSFRTYKRLGIKQPKRLDCQFILNVLATVRSFDPAEVEHMRHFVREQLQRQMTPRAEPTGERYMGMIQPPAPGAPPG